MAARLDTLVGPGVAAEAADGGLPAAPAPPPPPPPAAVAPPPPPVVGLVEPNSAGPGTAGTGTGSQKRPTSNRSAANWATQRAQKRQRLEEESRSVSNALRVRKTSDIDGSLKPQSQSREPAKDPEGSRPLPFNGAPLPPAQPAGFSGRHGSPPWRPDDKDGHYVFELGESLTPRYKILSKLGEGTFGRVVECWDRQLKAYRAVKIIRNVRKYRDAAMIEIEALSTLKRHDPEAKRSCVLLDEWFDYRGHVCMVFEKLGLSLYDFLRKNHYIPFSLDLVRAFGRQLLDSVAFLHDLTLIHTDLKPENILLHSPHYRKEPLPNSKHHKRAPTSAAIKLIDFGSATFNAQYHSSIVSTRHYRAPEVILGLGWSYPCDVWSVGCILVELVTGEALFQTHENLEHLAMMEKALGPFAPSMIKQADRHSQKYFRHGRELNWPEGASSRESVRAVRKVPRLKDCVIDAVKFENTGEVSDAEALVDLICKLLQYEPSERLTARQALDHPFFLRSAAAGAADAELAALLGAGPSAGPGPAVPPLAPPAPRRPEPVAEPAAEPAGGRGEAAGGRGERSREPRLSGGRGAPDGRGASPGGSGFAGILNGGGPPPPGWADPPNGGRTTSDRVMRDRDGAKEGAVRDRERERAAERERRLEERPGPAGIPNILSPRERSRPGWKDKEDGDGGWAQPAPPTAG